MEQTQEVMSIQFEPRQRFGNVSLPRGLSHTRGSSSGAEIGNPEGEENHRDHPQATQDKTNNVH